MKTSHQSTKKCKYRTLEKYSNTYYENKQNINPACACNTYLLKCLCGIMHLKPTAGCQISTLIFGFGGGDPIATWGLNQKYCLGLPPNPNIKALI
jgi:hypothetical protein